MTHTHTHADSALTVYLFGVCSCMTDTVMKVHRTDIDSSQVGTDHVYVILARQGHLPGARPVGSGRPRLPSFTERRSAQVTDDRAGGRPSSANHPPWAAAAHKVESFSERRKSRADRERNNWSATGKNGIRAQTQRQTGSVSSSPLICGEASAAECTCKQLNFTLPTVSFSATAMYCDSESNPTYNASESRCWLTPHSLQMTRKEVETQRGERMSFGHKRVAGSTIEAGSLLTILSYPSGRCPRILPAGVPTGREQSNAPGWSWRSVCAQKKKEHDQRGHRGEGGSRERARSVRSSPQWPRAKERAKTAVASAQRSHPQPHSDAHATQPCVACVVVGAVTFSRGRGGRVGCRLLSSLLGASHH